MSEVFTLFIFVIFYFMGFTYTLKKSKGEFYVYVFLMFALGGRLLFSSTYDVSFAKIIFGQSLISIHSILTILISIFFLPRNFFKFKFLGYFYMIFIIVFFSALYNHALNYGLLELIKFLYLFSMIGVFLTLLNLTSLNYFLKVIVYLILPVIFLQYISYFLGYAKDTEADGSISYIGTYYHEAVFSLVCFLLFISCCFLFSMENKKIWILISAVSILSIFLANYRTTILALIPLVIFMLNRIFYSKLHVESRRLVMFVSFPLIAFLIYLLINSDRFSDIATIFKVFDIYMLDPIYYDRATIQLLSGRLYLWSQYYQHYINGDIIQYVIGYGGGTWKDWAELYAHNQYISLLYEYGAVGFFVIIFTYFQPLFFYLFNKSQVYGENILLSVFCNMGLMMLSLGTMPLWSIEGIICLSLSLSFFYYNRLKMI